MIELRTPHEVEDNEKLESMIETLKSGGELPAIYSYGIDALSGVHRLAAWEACEMEANIIEIDDEWMARALEIGGYEFHYEVTDLEDLVEWIEQTKKD